MNYIVQQNVPMCPHCSALMTKVRGVEVFFRCNDCASKFQIVGIGQAEIELIVTDGEENE